MNFKFVAALIVFILSQKFVIGDRVCYPYEETSGIKMASTIYVCPDNTDCCSNGCCEKLYLAWYMWVFAIMAIAGCCFIAYSVKRHKLFRKNRIRNDESLRPSGVRRINVISRTAVFTTPNSPQIAHNTTSLGGVTTYEHVAHINMPSTRNPPAYTPTADVNDSGPRQQRTRVNNAQQQSYAPPSYSSIWQN